MKMEDLKVGDLIEAKAIYGNRLQYHAIGRIINIYSSNDIIIKNIKCFNNNINYALKAGIGIYLKDTVKKVTPEEYPEYFI